jgi:hypothetical protein
MPESVRRHISVSIPIFAGLALLSVVILPGQAQQRANKAQAGSPSKAYDRAKTYSKYLEIPGAERLRAETCTTCHDKVTKDRPRVKYREKSSPRHCA